MTSREFPSLTTVVGGLESRSSEHCWFRAVEDMLDDSLLKQLWIDNKPSRQSTTISAIGMFHKTESEHIRTTSNDTRTYYMFRFGSKETRVFGLRVRNP